MFVADLREDRKLDNSRTSAIGCRRTDLSESGKCEMGFAELLQMAEGEKLD
jgi:hypothetical protein